MEVLDKPVFVPPRKRGSKSSRSSNESLPIIGTGTNTSPQSCGKIDHLANRKLHHQPISSEHVKECLSVKQQSNSNTHKSNSCGRSSTYQNQSSKHTNGRSDESDLNSDISDYVHIIEGGYAEIELANERSALNSRSVSSIGSCGGNFVTMTGTVKRGRKKGQTMDMKVQMSREELDELEQSIRSQQIEDDDRCFFGIRKGPHILTFSLTLVPFVFILSAAYSFYMGTMTWYNILVYFSEKKTIFHKIFVSPLLIISYPFLITLSTIGLGIYASIVQISWHVDNWRREIQDWEKGFYGWLCGILDLEDCSPYEVVILTEVLPPVEEVKQQKLQVADTAL
ncbi:LOW QUALITY PROTEIN: transmembrane protein 169-like [Uloborus diversus]|uniref:LOW QUALITY PROTEIN: transmembrane protein 169-like n=1 Tax=Uloborus diversus TaxID=327109 RepID=UPI002409C91C|nr:LOW QUALITY PROTEIN: transmembrane protein 169-like [Uloborus diversus]